MSSERPVADCQNELGAIRPPAVVMTHSQTSMPAHLCLTRLYPPWLPVCRPAYLAAHCLKDTAPRREPGPERAAVLAGGCASFRRAAELQLCEPALVSRG